MTVFVLGFLLGCIDGLRSLTAPAVVCWAAHFGWLHFQDSKLAVLGHPAVVAFATLLALVELIVDKLPETPARTAPVGLIARLVLGGFCGFAIATSAGTNHVLGTAAASVGAIVGAFTGYNARRALVSSAHLPDFVVALAEDVIAIVGGLLVVSRFG
jgi:uncharacterized membrane protein